MNSGSIFKTIPQLSQNTEVFETLFRNQCVEIERITSLGVTSPENNWYDQEKAEWVMLVQGESELQFEGGHTLAMKAGDFVLIKPHEKHRVTYTSSEPSCIWLAFHFLPE